MTCPKCNVALSMSDRQGVEIDFCPQCRGVWLDRGELDKIIERSALTITAPAAPPNAGTPVAASPTMPPLQRDYRRHDDDDDDDDYRHRSRDTSYDSHRTKKKKSFLGDLFDF
jgi:Zn-finger nucleic acid-binding protein